MNWNMFLAVLSVILLFFSAVGMYVEPLTRSEALAEDLAPRIGVNQQDIQNHLLVILREYSMRDTIGRCASLIVLTPLLILRVIMDILNAVKERRRSSPKYATTPSTDSG